jgi:hypothetical protein
MNAPTQFRGAPVSSYETSYASPLKNSRVAASPRTYTRLESVPIGWEQDEHNTLTPRFVFVPPDAQHLAVDWGDMFDLRSGSGACTSRDKKQKNYDLSVTNGAYYIYGNEGLWNDKDGPTEKPSIGYTEEGSILAYRFDNHRRIIIQQGSPVEFPHGPNTDWTVRFYIDRFTRPDRSRAEYVAGNYVPGKAVAAISDDWISVIAQVLIVSLPALPPPPRDPTLRILSPEGPPMDPPPKLLTPIELVKVSLPYIPQYLSIVEPYAMIVSDEGSGSRVHCVDIGGHEQWSAVVPFAVRQPPIDGGNGRVYLAGEGLAAIENGTVIWSQPATETIRATAFVDGTLAVTQANTFRIIARDGTEVVTYSSHFDEPITSPPAITHDGTVLMASEKSLYVAR